MAKKETKRPANPKNSSQTRPAKITPTNAKAIRGGTSERRPTPTARPTAAKRPAARRIPSPKKPARFQGPTFSAQQKALIGGMALFFLAALLILSLLSPNQGQLTRSLSNGLGVLFGWGGRAMPFLLAGVGFYLVRRGMDQPMQLSRWRVVGAALLFLVFEALATLFVVTRPPWPNEWTAAQARLGGGYLGGSLTWLATHAAQTGGAVFIFVLLALAGLVLASGLTWADAQAWWARRQTRAAAPQPVAPRPARPARRAVITRAEPDDDADEETSAPARSPAAATTAAPQATSAVAKQPASIRPVAESAPLFITPRESAPVDGQWAMPDLTLMLEAGSEGELALDYIRDQANVIERTLESFGAPVELVETTQGPTVTMYGVRPLFVELRSGRRTKVKVSKIANLADDLALALSAKSVRIQAPVPGKGYVGIEVPNAHKLLVSLRDVMESADFQRITPPLRIGLGQDVAGQPISADLTKMPHLLVAGTTGSGKSVCINGIIACLLLQNSPDDLRFVMVDPKRVELTNYNGIPHLAAPVVTEMERVIGALQWALREMDHRYQLFAGAGARNITIYNKKAIREGQPKLPYIVIIIDELADLMLTAPEDTERALARLAQMSRATGIHLILATQRPSVDVVTGIIKANFPARIAFAVASATDSRVILDMVGAERLLGQGDMLFQRPDAPAPVRMQGCFVSDTELTKLIDYWKTARRFHRITSADAQPRSTITALPTVLAEAQADLEAELADERPAVRGISAESAPLPPTPPPSAPFQQPLWEHLAEQEQRAKEAADGEDELLPEAMEYLQRVKKASTSMLQRRFRIGYTRAARMMDILEERGMIGPPTGTSKARDVLVTHLTGADPAADDADDNAEAG